MIKYNVLNLNENFHNLTKIFANYIELKIILAKLTMFIMLSC